MGSLPRYALLARRGDPRGAIEVWADAYGDNCPRTRRSAELLVWEGELNDAVRVWEDCDPVRHNPISLYRQHLATLPDEERLEREYDEPEEMAGTWIARLHELFAHQGEEAVIAHLREQRTRRGGTDAAPRQ